MSRRGRPCGARTGRVVSAGARTPAGSANLLVRSASLAVSRIASLLACRTCPLCGAALGPVPGLLCGWCRARLYPNPRGAGVRIAGGGGRDRPGVLVHSPFLHAGSARELVIGLKFRGRRDLGRLAADLMTGAGSAPPDAGGSVIVPVPLCRARLRQRGYNQAEEIASALARAHGTRVSRCLSREDRPPQTGLSAALRRSNVRGAFRTGREAVPAGVPILLVDDVVTTGSTLDEAARFLEAAGGDVAGALTLTYRPEARGDIID